MCCPETILETHGVVRLVCLTYQPLTKPTCYVKQTVLSKTADMVGMFDSLLPATSVTPSISKHTSRPIQILSDI